ncbi:AAA family ATPase [Jeotgalibacillus campisalis]|uniref:Shikimate kinase n=1 Tax=Jeotgalibacillus campisalis TaxID=220754 RepID=A0A0C2VPM7_9BACL|nr:AAA family ATPase [Jeotgalibacillus campisalis]KIL46396.1 shikimate kinase [Jeotgalibacillus campisalis]
MKLILVFGPQAVGKMTVGQELSKLTELKLFHNHMTIDLLVPFFDFSPQMWRLTTLFREEIFEEFAKTNQYGMIFTFVWAFDLQGDWEFLEKVSSIFTEKGADLYFVELEANLEERLDRNVSPNRLQEKPTKRNIKQSEEHLLMSVQKHRLNSMPGEIQQDHYLRIDNTNLSAQETAEKIKKHFAL